ncbi:MAG: UvrD-helicase domain-containing protein [Acidobacteriota bacterium]|nr:MAG: UvrD-helicase domain-containing protein [Acidobacteriota bacterium]
MSSSKQVIDAEAREQAVLTDQHAFVWASAGTGKTHTLTLRALYLLFKFGAPGLFSPDRFRRLQGARSAIQSIVLTTFTRKAAAEMRTRLFQYMDLVTASSSLDLLEEQKAVKKDPLFRLVIERVLNEMAGGGFDRLQQAAQALGERASELQVSTIHSYAASILKRHPVEAGIPPDTRFADEDSDDVSGVPELLVERWWETQAQADPAIAKALSRVLEVATVGEINHWLVQIYYRPWIPEHAAGLSSIDEVALKRALLASRRLSEVSPLRPKLGKRMRQVVDAFPLLLDAAEHRGEWLELLKFLQDEKGYLFLDQRDNKFVDQIELLDPRYLEVFEQYLPTYSTFLCAALKFQLKEVWSEWTGVLQSFGNWTWGAALRELGLLTFDDVIRIAGEMLKRDEAVRQSEFRQIKALLVDEFQDTDRNQLELLAQVLRRPDQSTHEPLGFFVGDVKQSIYRFRGADVPAVKHFADNYENCVNCTLEKKEFRLVTSFRSARPVVSFVNQFFSEPLHLAAPEEQLVSFRGEGGEIAKWVVVEDTGERKMLADEARTALAEAAVDIIRESIQEEGDREPQYSKVLILTRTNGELNALLPVLTRAGIPVISGGAKSFLKNQEVLDTVNLLICLHNPLDTVALAAVLRSPVIGLDDDRINQLLSQRKAEKLLAEQDPFPSFISGEIADRLEQLRRLAVERRSSDFSAWIRRVEAMIPKASYVSESDPAGYAAARVTTVMQDFRDECIRGRIPPLVWLLRRREAAATADRWDEDLGEDVSITDETINAVRVMTVHKAKGLEASLVIAYGWGGIFQGTDRNSRSREEVVQFRSGNREVRGLALNWGGLRITSPEFSAALKADQDEFKRESERLAYVAATRAEDRLFLLQRESDLLKHEEIAAFLSAADDSGRVSNVEISKWVSPEPPEEDVAGPGRSVPEAGYWEHWQQKYRDLDQESVRLLASPSQVDRSESPFIDLPEYGQGAADSGGLEVGMLVHQYLEEYLLSSESVPEGLRTIASLQLDTPPSQKVTERAKEILEAFFNGISGDPEKPPYLEMLRQGPVLGREVPIYLTLNGECWHGIIDLVLEYSGTIYAVDYKTGRPHEILPASYARQREIYTAALKQLYPERSVAFMFWWLESRPDPPSQSSLPF